jgi:flagellar basal-body rod modification protein FlgD
MAIPSVSGQPFSSLAASTGTSSTASTGTASSTSLVGKTGTVTAEESRDTFLKLLVAQLAHQDPLKPMENADFTAQLAQFSMLEQLEAMNKNLRSMVDAQQGLNGLETKMQATSLVGKEVTIKGNSIQVHSGHATKLAYNLPAPSAHVSIEILNGAGQPIQVFNETNKPAGQYTVPRYGKDDRAKKLPDGVYTARVTAKDGAGQPVAVETFIQGRVNGVEYGADQPYFLMNKNRVAFSDIVSIQN